MSVSSVPGPEQLLAHREAVLRLARRLVRDEHDAQDVAQDAVLASLEQRGGVRSRRAWMVGVTRRLAARRWREESRRGRRERRVARPEALQGHSPDATLRVQKQLLTCVAALEQPFRDAIVMRFFEDRPPREIAARLRVPVATVKSRIRRGVERLRAQMDTEHGDRRQAWAGVLLGGTAARGAAPLGLVGGGVWMGWKAWACVAAALLLLVGGVWWSDVLDTEPESSTPTPGSGSALQDVVEVSPGLQGAEPGPSVHGVPAQTPGPQAGTRVHGRVVGEGRFPVVDVEVRLLARGRILASTQTDADGAFELLVTHAVEGEGTTACVLEARHSDGRGCHRPLTLLPPDDAGGVHDMRTAPLVLERVCLVRVRVTEGGEPAADVPVWLAWTPPGDRHAKKWHKELRVSLGRTDKEGRVACPGLAPGRIALLACRGSRLAIAGQDVSRQDALQVDLPLQRYPVIPITVTARPGEVPVIGARFAFVAFDGRHGLIVEPGDPDHPVAPTRADGRTEVVQPEAGTNAAVWLERMKYLQLEPEVPASTALAGQESLRFVVAGDAPLRIPLDARVVPAPKDGDLVALADARRSFIFGTRSMPSHGRIQAGYLLIPNIRRSEHVDFEAIATLSDGRIGHVMIPKGGDEPEPKLLTFGPPCEVDVRVTDASGDAVGGASVSFLRTQRNSLSQSVKTGADGLATHAGFLPGEPLEVRVTAEIAGAQIHGMWKTETRPEGTRVEAQLPEVVEIEVRFQVDGQPALPTRYRLAWGNGMVVLPAHTVEDPQRGVVRFAAGMNMSSAERKLALDAPGFASAIADVVEQEEGLRATFTLDSLLGLALTIRQSEIADVDVSLERYDEAYGRWFPRTRASAKVRGRHRFEALAPGRYRVRDVLSGKVTPAVSLVAGKGEQTVILDLAQQRVIQGHVDVPAAFDVSRAAVAVIDPGTGETRAVQGTKKPPSGPPATRSVPVGYVPVAPDGTFTFPVEPGVQLQAWHPLLGFADAVEVPTGGESIRLRIPRRPVLRFRVARDPESLRVPPGTQVVAYAGEAAPGAEPTLVTQVLVDGDDRAFGGLAPGTYTLWIYGGLRASLILTGVEVGTTDIDLGELRFTRGRSIRIVPAKDMTRARLRVRAVGRIGSGVVRSTMSRDKHGGATLEGLTPGTYHLIVRDLMAAGAPILVDREVVVPEGEDLVIDLEQESD